ncbi:MAG: hypothetical protein Ct9H300mP6_14680 [Gammaproteobacteria bacterium]|nr:MAG: hypothetical protein Ct9H300mP6_14680 [Gammaproteobacteria bacterium]
MFVDGIYEIWWISLNTSRRGKKELKVVKGPQSALYGRSTFGGAVNFIKKGS